MNDPSFFESESLMQSKINIEVEVQSFRDEESKRDINIDFQVEETKDSFMMKKPILQNKTESQESKADNNKVDETETQLVRLMPDDKKITSQKQILKHYVYLSGNFQSFNQLNKTSPLDIDSKIEYKKYRLIDLEKIDEDEVFSSIRGYLKNTHEYKSQKEEIKKNKILSKPKQEDYLLKNIQIYHWCDFYSKLFKHINLLNDIYVNNFSQVDLKTFLIYLILKNLVNQDTITSLGDINYKEILKSSLKGSLIQETEGYISMLLQSLDDRAFNVNYEEIFLFENDYEMEFRDFKGIYSSYNTMKTKILQFFLLRLHKETDLDEGKIDLFYLMMVKISEYFKTFFPYCCGRKHPGSLKNSVEKKIYFCFKCEILLCSKCIKGHKLHQLFDFESLLKKKFQQPHSQDLFNIESETKKIEDHNIDHLMDMILQNKKIQIKYSENHKSIEDYKIFSVYEFLQILLYEHLFKLVIELQLNNGDFTDFLSDKEIANILQISNLFRENKGKVCQKTLLKAYQESLKNLKDDTEERSDKNTLKEIKNVYKEAFYNKVSNEWNVKRELIEANQEISYDAPSDGFSLTISSMGSPKSMSNSFLFNKDKFKLKDHLSLSCNASNIAGKAANELGSSRVNDINSNEEENSHDVINPYIKPLTSDVFKYNFENQLVDTNNHYTLTMALNKIETKSTKKLLDRSIIENINFENIKKYNLTYDEVTKTYGFKSAFNSKFEMVRFYIKNILENFSNMGMIVKEKWLSE
jgi:hypothetical protein